MTSKKAGKTTTTKRAPTEPKAKRPRVSTAAKLAALQAKIDAIRDRESHREAKKVPGRKELLSAIRSTAKAQKLFANGPDDQRALIERAMNDLSAVAQSCGLIVSFGADAE